MLAWAAAVNGAFLSLHSAVHRVAAAGTAAAPAAAADGMAFLDKGGVAAVPKGQLQGSATAN